ncbi:MFS transporter [Streptomyces sp. A7024]|uniref:MFS transporter n=1 Tax=Streptomyces coryli TaxID=1128680 RepID=A0A6G4TVM8_9ACTN|nr:MFS transporter [Streptomyces coryli]NGN63097.1 MFS transporter [Streptomyces coryli]
MTTAPGDSPVTPPAGLWSRNFSLFFAARGIARLGDMMAPVALAAGLVLSGYGAGAVGAVLASMTACFAGFVIFGGVIADRVNNRVLMIGADLVRVVVQIVMAGLFYTDHIVVWQLCLLSAVNGICAALFQPGLPTLIPRIAADVHGANGAIRTIESLTTMAGPAVAGALVGLTEPGGVFVAYATTYLASAVCLALLRLPAADAGEAVAAKESSFRSDLVQGWQEFRSRTWLWGVIVIWMVLMVASWGPTMPLIATEMVSDYGAGALGLVNSAMGAGMAAGALIAMRVRPVRPLRAGGAALLLYWLQPASVALGLPVPAIAAGLALTGAANAFWGVMWTTSILTQVPADVRSRVHAYDVAGSVAMAPVGQALAGPAAGLFGARAVLGFNAVVSVGVAIALLSVPAIRNLRRVDGTPPAKKPARIFARGLRR